MHYTGRLTLLFLAAGAGGLRGQVSPTGTNGGAPVPDTALLAPAARSSAPDTQPDPLAAGIAAFEALDPRTALALFREALAADSLGYEPNFRTALTLITLGQETPDSRSSPARDSLYAEAERRARTAVKADTTRADGWFVLANAMGRAALTRPPEQRLRLAAAVRVAAVRAITLDSSHDGAYHVLGRWNAEIMRLPGMERFFARRVLGARIFGEASWEEATVNLEQAVALDSTRIVHRLDLAEIYINRKRYADARANWTRGVAARAGVPGPAAQARPPQRCSEDRGQNPDQPGPQRRRAISRRARRSACSSSSRARSPMARAPAPQSPAQPVAASGREQQSQPRPDDRADHQPHHEVRRPPDPPDATASEAARLRWVLLALCHRRPPSPLVTRNSSTPE